MVYKSNTKLVSLPITTAQLAVLAGIPQIGRSTIKKLVYYLSKREIDFGEFWRKIPAFDEKLPLTNNQINCINNYKKEYTISSYLEHLNSKEIGYISYIDSGYPPLLLAVEDFPALLYTKGNSNLLSSRQMIAVVGTRKITSYGKLACRKIVNELCLEGAVIASGFMYGVDAEAHQSAINSGGNTVGVLGYGFDYLFPKSQQWLFDEIISQGGVFISEFPPDTPPRAGQFPVRNRIIAGMSQAVVVIEAAAKSGTKITADCALEEGRLVCAVPGPITSPYSEGTKALLRDGALMVSSGGDIINELSSSYPESWGFHPPVIQSRNEGILPGKTGSIEKIIYDMLMIQPLSTEKLSQQIELPVVELNTLLTQLEIDGSLIRDGLYWTANPERN